ncbi:hypothetical protein O8H94_001147 [Escherichia coli O157]|nr:hypothetical protein [Escherichia coli O157]EKH6024615.1 hypothetical protein [Escherichia coli O157]EKH6094051.1 hypothetical protein [Escherichia coli O157]
MTAKPQSVIHHVITRVYHENEIGHLPEHIKVNLRKIVSVCDVEKITWPKPKDRLIEITDGEQRVLAYYHPIGMQNAVFQYYFKEHGGAFARGFYAYVDPDADVFDFKISANCLLPTNVLAEGLAATLYDRYIHEMDSPDFVANSDLGWIHLPADIAEAAKYIRHRNVLPVVMPEWRDSEYGWGLRDKLQSVHLASVKTYSRSDILALLKDYDEDYIHPMGFLRPNGVCWNEDLQRVEVNVGGRWRLNWVPVVGVENQTERLVDDIERTGYVRWDISDLKA